MISMIKMAHVGHVIGVKLLNTKVALSGGVLASSLATGLAIQMTVPREAIDYAGQSINNAIETESGVGLDHAVPVTYDGEALRIVRTDFAEGRLLLLIPVEQTGTGEMKVSSGQMPQLIVVGKRMTLDQQAAYDSEMLFKHVAAK